MPLIKKVLTDEQTEDLGAWCVDNRLPDGEKSYFEWWANRHTLERWKRNGSRAKIPTSNA